MVNASKLKQSIELKKEKKKEEKMSDERNAKCEPVAGEIIQIIAKYKIDPKEVTHEQKLEIYGPIQREINKVFLEKGFTVSEVNFTFSIVQVTLDLVKSLCIEAVQYSFDYAEQKLWKVDHIKDITLQQIDDVLQSE